MTIPQFDEDVRGFSPALVLHGGDGGAGHRRMLKDHLRGLDRRDVFASILATCSLTATPGVTGKHMIVVVLTQEIG